MSAVAPHRSARTGPLEDGESVAEIDALLDGYGLLHRGQLMRAEELAAEQRAPEVRDIRGGAHEVPGRPVARRVEHRNLDQLAIHERMTVGVAAGDRGRVLREGCV